MRIYSPCPADIRRWLNVDIILFHRLRRRTNNKPTLVHQNILQKNVCAGFSAVYGTVYYSRVVLSEAVDWCICFTQKINMAVTESDPDPRVWKM